MSTVTSNTAASSPARETTNNRQPADKAQVSGPVAPAQPAKKQKLSPIEAARKLVEDTSKAHQTSGDALAEARAQMANIERQTKFDAAWKAIHEALLRADRQSRESALSALQILLDEDGQRVLTDYQVALSEEVQVIAAAAKKEAEDAEAAKKGSENASPLTQNE